MANYYRVNLKDKAGNIIYPSIHNLISIDKTTGGMTFSQGSIALINGGLTLTNGKVISKGLSLRGGHLYLEGTYSAVLDNTTKIVFGTPESNYANITANNGGAIGFYASLTDKTNGFFWNPGQKAISPENNNQISCGMSDKRWTNVYSVGGNFSGTINSSVATDTHINGAKGTNVAINMTGTASYRILSRLTSTNGVFTMGAWTNTYNLFYIANTLITKNTNNYTYRATLLDESGMTTLNALTVNGNILLSNSATSWRGLRGTMGDNDYWYIGGKADAVDGGYMLIATGDGGNEPIYVRQFSSGAPPTGTVARTLTLLDASGNTTLPGHLLMTNGKYIRLNTNSGGAKTTLTSGCGICSGGDQANAADANIRIFSWYGVGFTPTISGQTIPQGENAVYINCRSGALTARGAITAPRFSGQLNKSSTFYNNNTQGISYYDGEAMSTTASNNGWATPNAGWFQILHLDLSVNSYYNDIYVPVNEHNCLWWRQRRGSSYYGFMSIPASTDNTVRVFRAGAIATWNSNYSNYVNGTVMFCW